MAKLIVTDAVRGCDLEKVALDTEPLSLTLTGKNSVQEIFTLRGFYPETVNGEYHLMEDVCYRLL